MFTGLIEKVGLLQHLERGAADGRIAIRCEPWEEPLKVGESVSVNGACLSVVTASDDGFVCDVLGETLARTTLGAKRNGDRLNLERAMRADGRFGGHIVTGHVDGVCEVAEVRNTGRDWELTIRCDGALMTGIVFKGSIAVDGVSLTVARVEKDTFSVCIIPLTWQHTSLAGLRAGGRVNLETDILGKYVLRHLVHRTDEAPRITPDALAAAGFVS